MGRSRGRLTFVGALIAASTLAVAAIGASVAASKQSGTPIATANSGETAIGTSHATLATRAARRGVQKPIATAKSGKTAIGANLSTRAVRAAGRGAHKQTSRRAPLQAPSALGSSGSRVPHGAPPCGPKDVLIVYSDTAPPTQLVTALQGEADVTSVDLFDAQVATPTLDDLNPYNLVITWSNFPYADQNAAGDVLADYQDSGQGFVIPLVFSFYDGVWGLFGRWRADGYSPFTYSTAIEFGSFTLGAHDPSHPLMQGVTDLSTNFRINLALDPGATQVAAWSDSVPLVAFKENVVAINAYIGPEAQWSGQFSRVMVNAFNWLCGGPPPPPPPPPPPRRHRLRRARAAAVGRSRSPIRGTETPTPRTASSPD